MNAAPLDVDLHLLNLRFASARLLEPLAVQRLARSIERDGQIVPCIVVGWPDSSDAEGTERLVLIVAGWRRCVDLAATEPLLSGGGVTWRRLFWVCWRAHKAGPLPPLKRRCCCAS